MAASHPDSVQSRNDTVDPRSLNKAMAHNPYQSKRFNAEEWETWMQWDGAVDSLSPHSPSNHSNTSLAGAGMASQGSTSPSEAESLPVLPLTPVYRIPSIEAGPKATSPGIDQVRRQPTKKRKTSIQVDVNEARTRQPKGQKISHNVIEKRYRTNLNDKIARLRDSVPVLKTAFEANQKQTSKGDADSASDESGSDDKASAQGLKFNKATVLTKATEYIEQLEKANARLASENTTLRRRARDDSKDVHAPKPLYFRSDEAHATGSSLTTYSKVQIEQPQSPASPSSPTEVAGKIPVAAEFQRLRAEAADGPSYAPTAPTPEPLSPSPTAEGSESSPATPAAPPAPELIDFDSVRGSIPVPDYITRNRVPISQQQHYAPPADGRSYLDGIDDPYIYDDDEQRAWWPRSRASKVLLGSLAGLMIMEGLNANVDSPKPMPPGKHSPHQKRKFLPSDFYTESRGFRAQIRQRIIDFAHTPRGKQLLPILFLASVILFVVFLAFVYWTRKNPKARRRANSVSSNPERYEPSSRKNSVMSERTSGLVQHIVSSQTAGHHEDPGSDHRVVRSAGYISEAAMRLKACWHILTTGVTTLRPYDQMYPGGNIPRIVIVEDSK